MDNPWKKIWPVRNGGNVSESGWKVEDRGEKLGGDRYAMAAEFLNGWRIEAVGGLDPNGKPIVTSMSFREAKSGTLEVTTNLLREMPSGRILSELRKSVAEWMDMSNAYLGHYSEAEWLDLCRGPRWPGRGYETADVTYAALAFTYLSFVSSGETKPVEALAAHMSCSRATASTRLAYARANGFLEKPGERNRGGRLTAKSERLLGLTPIDPTDSQTNDAKGTTNASS